MLNMFAKRRRIQAAIVIFLAACIVAVVIISSFSGSHVYTIAGSSVVSATLSVDAVLDLSYMTRVRNIVETGPHGGILNAIDEQSMRAYVPSSIASNAKSIRLIWVVGYKPMQLEVERGWFRGTWMHTTVQKADSNVIYVAALPSEFVDVVTRIRCTKIER